MEKKKIALVELEDQGQDIIELDVYDNDVIIGDSCIFREDRLKMLGIGTHDGIRWYEGKSITDIDPGVIENSELYVYFYESSLEKIPVPWECQIFKYKVTSVKKL